MSDEVYGEAAAASAAAATTKCFQQPHQNQHSSIAQRGKFAFLNDPQKECKNEYDLPGVKFGREASTMRFFAHSVPVRCKSQHLTIGHWDPKTLLAPSLIDTNMLRSFVSAVCLEFALLHRFVILHTPYIRIRSKRVNVCNVR